MKRLGLIFCVWVFARAVAAADLQVSNGWIRLLPAGVPAAGYFEVRNVAAKRAELVGASSPAFAQAMIHRSTEEKGRSSMTHVHDVEVPAGGRLVFRPGGYHIMLMKPTRTLSVGDKVPVTLEFRSGEKITAQFEVRGPLGKMRTTLFFRCRQKLHRAW